MASHKQFPHQLDNIYLRILLLMEWCQRRRRAAPSRADMAKHFNISERAINERIQRLARDGFIEVCGRQAYKVNVNLTCLTLNNVSQLISNPYIQEIS
jgi:predicted transcriptional regulator